MNEQPPTITAYDIRKAAMNLAKSWAEFEAYKQHALYNVYASPEDVKTARHKAKTYMEDVEVWMTIWMDSGIPNPTRKGEPRARRLYDLAAARYNQIREKGTR